jgi:DNA modification methylase
VFFFTKSQKYYFDLDSIRKPLAESSIKKISQENIPNQFKSGKSDEFAETKPVNNIPKIMNNMHKKYKGVYSNLTPEESEKYGSPRARNMRKISYDSKYQESDYGQTLQGFTRNNTIEKARTQSYIDAVKLFPDDVTKQKEYIKNVHDHLGDPNGANPGDILFDETFYDLYTDPNIQDAFIEYLEQERPELLMPSILDIPTMSHSFAHFAVFPETLVDPLIKAGCSPDVCVKCGKPKMMEYRKEEVVESRETLSQGNTVDGLVNRHRFKWVPIGFKPSCNCNASFEPGTVLDPFSGSGTVGVVAKKQRKSAILIEISPEYAEIIKNRLEIEASGTNMNVKFVETASISSLEEEE